MDLREKWNALTQKSYGKDLAGCTEREPDDSLLDLTKDEIAEKPLISGDKKVYYISAEFLIGKLLSNKPITWASTRMLKDCGVRRQIHGRGGRSGTGTLWVTGA